MKKEIEQLMEKLADKSLTFGDHVQIPQRRFGEGDEMYLYKVIGRLRSNTYVDVPVRTPEEEKTHGDVVEVIRVVCCGVCEDKVSRFRIEDVKFSGHPVTMLDVLVKMGEQFKYGPHNGASNLETLALLWEPLGFKTSLNQIFENTEWETESEQAKRLGYGVAATMSMLDKMHKTQVPKDPNTKALFSLLISLNLLPKLK